MTTYPAIIPSSREFGPGKYPHTIFRAMSGEETSVRHSSAMIESPVELRYSVLDEAEMIEILDHYDLVKGGFLPFAVPTIVWSGNENANEFTLPGNAWRYARPPEVEEVFCGGGTGNSGAGYIVTVTLESIPGEGVGLLGVDLTVTMSLVAGRAATTSGVNLTIGYSLATGITAVAGAAATVTMSLVAGTANGNLVTFVPGDFFFIGMSLRQGLPAAGLSRVFTLTYSLANDPVFASADPDFGGVELLLHGWDGVQDASLNNVAITAGSAVTTTSNALFGGEAILMSEVADSWISFPAITLSGNFAVDIWVYFNTLPTGGVTTSLFGGSTGYMRITASGGVSILYGSGAGTATIGTAGGVIETGKWQLIRFTAASGTPRIFVDGALAATGSTGGTISMTLDRIGVLNDPPNSINLDYRLDGAIQGVRFSGVSRSTAAFTLPTQSWPDSTNRIQAGLFGIAKTITMSLAPGTASGA